MRNGSKTCPDCGTKYFFVDYQADIEPSDQPCEGCEVLMPILEESARRLAAEKAAAPSTPPVETMSISEIEQRLRAGHQRTAAESFDSRMAAAGMDSE